MKRTSEQEKLELYKKRNYNFKRKETRTFEEGSFRRSETRTLKEKKLEPQNKKKLEL